MKNNSFVKGATILIIFNLIGKVIGAIYRIPLAKILGPVGMGQYQLTFPLYCLILTISTSGIPIAISKLVSGYNSENRFSESKKLLKISILVLTLLSLLGTAIVVFCAKYISKWQGNISTYICYYGIAPAIMFVGVLSAFRGYFQGNMFMFPTAISGLIEQIVKLAAGLFFSSRMLELGVEYAVFGALLGISVSEFLAFMFLLVSYLVYTKKHKAVFKKAELSFKFLTRQLVSLSVPITLGGLISPITAMVDSFLVVNLLMLSGFSSSTSTMMLGLQAGIVEPLVNIPVIIAVSISTALLPSISKLLKDADSKEKIKVLIEKAFQISLSISACCFICFVVFGEQILSFLYGSSLDFDELTIAVKLLFIGGFNIIFLSLVQVSASALQGLGYQKYPVKTLFVGCVIKIVLDLILIRFKAINIIGAVIAGGVCYFVVFVLNYSKIKKLTGACISNIYFYVAIQECFVCLFAFFANILLKMVVSDTISMIIAGIVSGLIFLLTYYIFFMYEKRQGVLTENRLD